MWTKLNCLALSLFARVQTMHLDREEGQALVEYTLILALVSIAAIVVLGKIGGDIVAKLKVVEEAL